MLGKSTWHEQPWTGNDVNLILNKLSEIKSLKYTRLKRLEKNRDSSVALNNITALLEKRQNERDTNIQQKESQSDPNLDDLYFPIEFPIANINDYQAGDDHSLFFNTEQNVFEPELAYSLDELAEHGIEPDKAKSLITKLRNTGDLTTAIEQVEAELEKRLAQSGTEHNWLDNEITRNFARQFLDKSLTRNHLAHLGRFFENLNCSSLTFELHKIFDWLLRTPHDEYEKWKETCGLPEKFFQNISDWISRLQVQSYGLSSTQLLSFSNESFLSLFTSSIAIEDWIEKQLNNLIDQSSSKRMVSSQRGIRVIQRRYALAGYEKQTLEEIGELEGVTRERIRQIEAKYLNLLSSPINRQIAQTIVEQNKELFHQTLAPNGVYTQDSSTKGISNATIQKFEPAMILILDFIEPGVNGLLTWLNQNLVQFETTNRNSNLSCWVQRHLVEEVRAYHNLHPTILKKLPRTLNDCRDYIPSGLSPGGLRAIIEIHEHYIIKSGTHVISTGSPRERDCVRLHKILMNRQVPLSLHRILFEYNETYFYQAEPLSFRNLHRLLRDYSHLFLELHQNHWLAIEGSIPKIVQNLSMLPKNYFLLGEVQDLNHPHTPWSTSKRVNSAQTCLQESDQPLRLGTIAAYVATHTTEAFDEATMGFIIQAHPQFIRFAPGMYGLAEHLNCRTSDEFVFYRAIKQYLIALESGDIEGLYPLWTLEMEHKWFEWLKASSPSIEFDLDEKNLLLPFIKLCRIDEPIFWLSQQTDKPVEKIKQDLLDVQLQTKPMKPLQDEYINTTKLFSGVLWSHIRGNINWVQFNIACSCPIERSVGKTGIKLMEKLGLITRTDSYSYKPTDRIPAILESGLRDLKKSGKLDWKGDFGETIQELLLASIDDQSKQEDKNELKLYYEQSNLTTELESVKDSKSENFDGISENLVDNILDDFDF